MACSKQYEVLLPAAQGIRLVWQNRLSIWGEYWPDTVLSRSIYTLKTTKIFEYFLSTAPRCSVDFSNSPFSCEIAETPICTKCTEYSCRRVFVMNPCFVWGVHFLWVAGLQCCFPQTSLGFSEPAVWAPQKKQYALYSKLFSERIKLARIQSSVQLCISGDFKTRVFIWLGTDVVCSLLWSSRKGALLRRRAWSVA